MKSKTKKIVEVTLTIVAAISFILMFGESPDGSPCVLWTLGWMASLAVCAKILDKMGTFDREGSR